MPITVTLRLDEDTYRLFSLLAEQDNRPLSNFIETAAKRFIEGQEFVDEFEMAELRNNLSLNASLKRSHEDAAQSRGRSVEEILNS